MKLTIDTEQRTMTEEESGKLTVMDLYSKRAFELISRHWLRVGWSLKYPYTFSWMGRPIIQLPEDMVRTQEVIYRLKPDVIIEACVAHGGSLIYYASLCKILGKGRVIGVDIEVRSHNRRAIEAHELASWITLVEGDSTSPEIVNGVKAHVGEGATTLVFLDSNHSKDHVLKELEAYHGLVSTGSYIVATDGIMRDVHDVPRGSPDWTWNNPAAAAEEFLRSHPEFVMEQPAWPFCESELTANVTHWPAAWLRRI